MNINKLHHDFLKFDIQSLHDYIIFIENGFEPFFAEIQKRFDELQNIPDSDPIKIADDNHESYYDHLIGDTIDEHYEHNVFQQRYRFSVIIQLYVFLETELSKIAFNSNEEVKGNFIESVKTTLKDKVLITDLKEYNFIKKFSTLRNIIVHNNGRISDFTKKGKSQIPALKQLKKIVGFELEEKQYPNAKFYSFKITDKEFLLFCLKKIENFLNTIYIGLSNIE